MTMKNVNLAINRASEPTSKRFKLPQHIAQEFDLYCSAAREEIPDLSEDEVAASIFEQHMKKDRAFRTWLKQQRKAGLRAEAAPAGSGAERVEDEEAVAA